MATITPVAYYTGSTIPGTEQIGDLSIGTTAQDYGVVGSNNGITYYSTPNQDNGYIIAHVDLIGRTSPAGGTPKVGFWRTGAKTDESFLNFVNGLFLQNLASAGAAKTWLNSNNYWTSYSAGIITNGLTFHIDASNPLSYPGSGSVIYDISGNNKNQTFYGGASWQSGNGGYINLQGGGYTQGPQPSLNLTNMTFSSWMFTNNIFNSGGNFLFSFQDNPNWYFNVTVENAQYPGKVSLYSTKWSSSNTTLSNGTWYFVTATFEPNITKIYVNGILDITDSSVGASSAYSPEPPGNDLYIGNRYNVYYMNGGVAQSMMYNRTLSDAEVLQNFNATKTRFGL